MVDVRADRIGGIPLACERKGEDDRACVHHREEEWQSRERVKRGARMARGIHARAHTRAHTEKFIPENRGCVSTSMAAGRSMHSPPPELTDAGRRGGQPLHARCHRNALSLKHRLIITDARPFSLSPSSAAIFTPPLGYPVGEPEAATTHSPFLTAFSSLPRSFSLSLSLPSSSLAFTSLSRQRARCPRFSFCLTCLRVAVACVMTEMVGKAESGSWTSAASPFALRATFSRSNYRQTASCTTS